MSVSSKSFQNVRPASSFPICAMTPASNSEAMSVAPRRRSSTSGSMDSSCVLRSACGTSYWYMTAPTYPNSMFSANGDGVSVTVSLKEMTPERNPDITCFSAGRSYTSCRHSRAVSNSSGKFFRVRAALSSCAARSRCCHKGTRLPGLARGRNNDRAAHSRNRAAYSTLSPTCVSMMRCSSSVSNSSSSRIGRLPSPSGRRMMMPSSAAYTCPSNPYRCLIRVVMAMAHGSCTRLPYGEWTITRQSPSSSWQRSTTSSRSLGIVPVAARCSASRSARLPMALSSNPSRRRRAIVVVSNRLVLSPAMPSETSARSPCAISRMNRPWDRPNAASRPSPSPCQNGSRAVRPGAGTTTTRSRVISWICQVDVPRVMTSPTRDSYTISSSSSPTLRGPGPEPSSGSTTV